MIKSKKIKVSIFALLMITIIPFVLIAFYSRPSADDFSSSFITKQYINGDWNVFGLLKLALSEMVDKYYTWQGTYTSMFMFSLQPSIFDEKLYFIYPLLLYIYIYIALLIFVSSIKRILNIDINRYLASLVLFVAIINGLPSTIEGLFWYNGSVHYMPYFFTVLIIVSLSLRKVYLKNSNYLIVLSVLSFFVSGGNQLTSFLNIMLLMILFYLDYSKNKTKTLLIPLFTAITGFVIMFIAPGNIVRIEAVNNTQSIIKTMVRSSVYCFQLVCRFVNIEWCALMLMSLPLALEISLRFKNRLKSPALILLISLIVYCGVICVPYLPTGGYGSGRIENVFWLLFMFLSLINWNYFLVYILNAHNKILRDFGNKYKKQLLIICVVVMCLNIKGNSASISLELISGNAQKFAKAYDNRLKIMEECEFLAVVEPLPESPNLLMGDITCDINNWINKAWSKYYGVDTIINPKSEQEKYQYINVLK